MNSVEHTVLIADDHAIYRKDLRSTLEAAGGYRIVGEASSGREALRLQELAPDLLVLDLDLGDLNGVRELEEVRRLGLSTKAIVLSAHVDDELVQGVLEAGASGYLLKNEPESRLLEGLPAIAIATSPERPGMVRGAGSRKVTSPTTSSPTVSSLETLRRGRPYRDGFFRRRT